MTRRAKVNHCIWAVVSICTFWVGWYCGTARNAATVGEQGRGDTARAQKPIRPMVPHSPQISPTGSVDAVEVATQSSGSENNHDFVSVPKSVLDFVYAPIFPPGADRLIVAKSMLLKLGISKSNLNTAASMITEALDDLSTLEVAKSKLIKDEKKGDYFEIPAFPDEGQQLAEKLQSKLSTIAPDVSAQIIVNQARANTVFGKLGQYRQEVFLEEIPSSGGSKTMVTVKFFDKDGREVISDMSGMPVGMMRERYGKLFETRN